jgi:type I restriction enzyme M protein
MLSNELRTQIRSLWDAFWSGGIANPLTAIEQITYLIFLKRLEVMDNENAMRDPSHKSLFEGEYGGEKDEKANVKKSGIPKSVFRWSNILQMENEDRLRHMQLVFEWLKTLPNVEDRFRDAVFIIPSPRLLQTAVSLIDSLFIPSQNYDTLGDIYEYLLSEIAESGKNGQFRTPRHIIRAMIDMVDPAFGERICDPACGTGGFLVNSYLHILKEQTSDDILKFEADGTPIFVVGDKLSSEDIDALRNNHFYGYDFDRTMVRLSWMNMIQHGMQNPQMNYADTLGSRFNEQLTKGEIGGFDVVLANPPFTGSIDSDDIGSSLQPLGTTKTELLFVELILQLLNLGGRAAVIVPEGLLFGSTRAHVNLRKKLVEENQLNAVISLPGGVFQPYTGVKTSILIFVKGGKTESVWFYELQHDGYSLDAKRNQRPERNDLWDTVLKYRLRFSSKRPMFLSESEWNEWHKVSDEERSQHLLNPIIGTEMLENIGESVQTLMLHGFEAIPLKEFRDWTASIEAIAENDYNLSAGRYKPLALNAASFTSPKQLIYELQNIEDEIQNGLSKLLEMLGGEE